MNGDRAKPRETMFDIFAVKVLGRRRGEHDTDHIILQNELRTIRYVVMLVTVIATYRLTSGGLNAALKLALAALLWLLTAWIAVPAHAKPGGKRLHAALAAYELTAALTAAALLFESGAGAAQTLLCCLAAALYALFRRANRRLAERLGALERENGALARAAYTDKLTGALNRRALDEYLDYLSREYGGGRSEIESLDALFFDIDSFKSYNDHYTHPKGDEALVRVCGAIERELEGGEELLFRYGGEEFVVITAKSGAGGLLECAQRMKAAVWNENIPRDDGCGFERLTVTVGCETERLGSCENYILEADRQLYKGKSSGKNCVVFKGEVHK